MIVSRIWQAFRIGVRQGYGDVTGIAKAFAAIVLLTGGLPLAAQADPVTILAFGDSLTQGYGLDEGDGFVPQMQHWLTDKGADVTVINAGVSGDTTAGGAARIGWSLNGDIDAVIVALGGNDMLRGIDPVSVQDNLDAILTAINAAGLPTLLVATEASGNFGPDYKAAFDGIYPALAGSFGVALFPNFLQGLADLNDVDRVMHSFMQGDGLHPNAAGVALVVARMGPAVLALVDGVK